MVNEIEYVFEYPETEYRIFELFSKIKGKYQFQNKTFTKFILGDMIYEVTDMERKKEVRTYTNVGVDHKVVDGIHVLHYNRSKVPYYLFPSKKELNDVVEVSRTSFKIHNVIHLNFEINQYQDKSRTFKVYVLVQNNNQVEEGIVKNHVNKVLTLLHNG